MKIANVMAMIVMNHTIFIQDKPDWALQKDGRSKSMASVSEAPRLSESDQVYPY